ncbi:MAG: hypothetical protein WAM60_25070, partial [Candidatus Promineifilaceae bacterium]
ALGTGSLSADSDITPYAPAPPLSESLQTFWQSGPELEQLQLQIRPPETPYPILERLGPPPFLPEARHHLPIAYDAISEEAISIAFREENEMTPQD